MKVDVIAEQRWKEIAGFPRRFSLNNKAKCWGTKKMGLWFDIVKQYRDVETRLLWSSCHPQGWDEQQDWTPLKRAVHSWHQSSSMAIRYEIMRLLLSIWISGQEKGFKTEIYLKHRWRLFFSLQLEEGV